MIDEIESDASCPACGKKQWWFTGVVNGKNDTTVAIISECSACNRRFKREIPVVLLDTAGKIVKSDAEIVTEAVKNDSKNANIAEIFLQKNWKALDAKIVDVRKTSTGYHMQIATGSGWDVPSTLIARIALLMHTSKSSVAISDVKKHCTGYSPYTVDHALRLMKHIGVLSSVRRGMYHWSFML